MQCPHTHQLFAIPAVRLLVLAVAWPLALACTARAQTYYSWDGNGSDSGGVGGSGTWDTTSGRFYLGSTYYRWDTNDNTTNRVLFAGTAGTVAVAADTTVQANGFRFSTTNYTLTSGNNAKIELYGTTPTVTVDSGKTATLSAVVIGSSLTFNGGGTLRLGGSSDLDRLANTMLLAIEGNSTLALNGKSEITSGVTLMSGTISGSGRLTASSYTVHEGTISANLAGSTTAAGLTKESNGTVTLSGANTYAGATTVNAGTLRLGRADRLLDSSALTVSGGTFDLRNYRERVAAVTLNSGSIIGSSTLTGSSFMVRSGLVGANLAGLSSAVGLTKDSPDTVILSGRSTYTGPTAIQAGTLRVDGSLSGNSVVGVSRGATLSGSGSVGRVTLDGTISPGGGIGTLSTGSERWSSGGAYRWEIDNAVGSAGTGWDFLNISGALTSTATAGSPFSVQIFGLDSSGQVGTVAGFDNTRSYSWLLLTASGGLGGLNLATLGIDAGGFVNPLGGGTFALRAATNSLYLDFNTAIPEPQTYALLLGVATLGIAGVRRWRARLR